MHACSLVPTSMSCPGLGEHFQETEVPSDLEEHFALGSWRIERIRQRRKGLHINQYGLRIGFVLVNGRRECRGYHEEWGLRSP